MTDEPETLAEHEVLSNGARLSLPAVDPSESSMLAHLEGMMGGQRSPAPSGVRERAAFRARFAPPPGDPAMFISEDGQLFYEGDPTKPVDAKAIPEWLRRSLARVMTQIHAKALAEIKAEHRSK